jgi:hypothetical protein
MTKAVCEKHQLRIPRTNADRIRSMTDEELASFMEGFSPSKKWSLFLDGKSWLDWMRQEAKDA